MLCISVERARGERRVEMLRMPRGLVLCVRMSARVQYDTSTGTPFHDDEQTALVIDHVFEDVDDGHDLLTDRRLPVQVDLPPRLRVVLQDLHKRKSMISNSLPTSKSSTSVSQFCNPQAGLVYASTK